MLLLRIHLRTIIKKIELLTLYKKLLWSFYEKKNSIGRYFGYLEPGYKKSILSTC